MWASINELIFIHYREARHQAALRRKLYVKGPGYCYTSRLEKQGKYFVGIQMARIYYRVVPLHFKSGGYFAINAHGIVLKHS